MSWLKKWNVSANMKKTEDFLGRKCKGLHNFLLSNGGDFVRAVANAEKSMLSKIENPVNILIVKWQIFFMK